MDLNRRAESGGHLDLRRVGGYEQRHPDAGIVQPRDEGRERVVLADHVEPAFGREFFPALRHQTDRMRSGRERNPQHVLGRCHLEIQRLGDFGLEAGHVGVADMAAVLAQMRGDSVGARLDRGQRGAHRIWPRAAAGVAQGGDVIDIDSEAQRWSFRHYILVEIQRVTLPINALDPCDDGLGAQLGDNSAEMLQVIDLEIDGQLGEIG